MSENQTLGVFFVMFMRTGALSVLVSIMGVLPVQAAPIDDLLVALRLEETIDIMQEEGLNYGAELGQDMLPSGNSVSWQRNVARIYDRSKMYDAARNGIKDALEDTDLTTLIAFFTEQPGAQFVDLELSARRAIMDEGVEDMARANYHDAEDAGGNRFELIDRFVAVNDLIEGNVEGGLNASYSFYMGLADGGALDLSNDEMVDEIWGQEDEQRTDTREWVYGYLLLAYGPMSDADIVTYTEMSETDEGQALNRALFAGFDQMYNSISYALGLAAAQEMTAQEL